MKIAKFLLTLTIALLLSVITGGMVSAATGLDPIATIGIPAVLSFIPSLPIGGVMLSGVYVEVWTGEMIKRFRQDKGWLTRIPKRNELVNKNAIHLVDVGADPEVLINNTTYPIGVVSREDEDIVISLDKFDTVNTVVTDDELYAISYDKMGLTNDLHRESLEEKTADKAAHALAPASNTTDTPVIQTTGESNGETYARKRMTKKDMIKMKRKLDDLGVPKQGRMALLCNSHVEDLLLDDEAFEKQYKNIPEGTLLRQWGFDIYEYNTMPDYKVTDDVLTKKAFGAAADPTNDQQCSLFFYPQRAFSATGELKMYFRESASDPENRRNTVGFKIYDICLPKSWTGFGAIVSSKV